MGRSVTNNQWNFLDKGLDAELLISDVLMKGGGKGTIRAAAIAIVPKVLSGIDLGVA